MPDRQHLYFMLNPYTGLIKVGIAFDVRMRLHDLSCMAGVHLRLLAHLEHGAQYEKPLHEAFTADRTIGEWFVPSDALLALVDDPKRVPAFLVEMDGEIRRRRAEKAAAEEPARLEREQLKAIQAEKARETARLKREAERKKQEAARAREKAKQDRQAARAAVQAEEHAAQIAAWRSRNPAVIAQRSLIAADSAAVKARADAILARQRERNALLIGVEPIGNA